MRSTAARALTPPSITPSSRSSASPWATGGASPCRPRRSTPATTASRRLAGGGLTDRPTQISAGTLGRASTLSRQAGVAQDARDEGVAAPRHNQQVRRDQLGRCPQVHERLRGILVQQLALGRSELVV